MLHLVAFGCIRCGNLRCDGVRQVRSPRPATLNRGGGVNVTLCNILLHSVTFFDAMIDRVRNRGSSDL
jgi:hypothetical protein